MSKRAIVRAGVLIALFAGCHASSQGPPLSDGDCAGGDCAPTGIAGGGSTDDPSRPIAAVEAQDDGATSVLPPPEVVSAPQPIEPDVQVDEPIVEPAPAPPRELEPRPAPTRETPPSPGQFSVSWGRTLCCGDRPSYDARVDHTGVLTFEGYAGVGEAGPVEATLDPDVARAIWGLIADAEFFSFDRAYESEESGCAIPLPEDGQSHTITAVADAEEHAVDFYDACGGMAAVEELEQLVADLEALSGVAGLIE